MNELFLSLRCKEMNSFKIERKVYDFPADRQQSM